jgi:hypothetical protein
MIGTYRDTDLSGQSSIEATILSKTDFVVGWDNPLIRAAQYLSSKAWMGLAQIDEIHLADMAEFGVLGRTHLISVTAEDLANFEFLLYGPATPRAIGRELSDRRLGAISNPTYRPFVLESYRAIREIKASTLTDVRMRLPQIETRFRRLLTPLGRGNEITHVLGTINVVAPNANPT